MSIDSPSHRRKRGRPPKNGKSINSDSSKSNSDSDTDEDERDSDGSGESAHSSDGSYKANRRASGRKSKRKRISREHVSRSSNRDDDEISENTSIDVSRRRRRSTISCFNPPDNNTATISITTNYKNPNISPDYERYLQSLDLNIDCFSIQYSPPEPIIINNDRNYIDLDKSLFMDELKCPICLGEIDKTWAVMACLHRFCGECLHRYLRINKAVHDCPNCRTKIASRRSSTADLTYDDIINVLFGDNNDPGQTVIDLALYKRKHQDNIRQFRIKQHEFTSRRIMNPFIGSNHNEKTDSCMICISLAPWLETCGAHIVTDIQTHRTDGNDRCKYQSVSISDSQNILNEDHTKEEDSVLDSDELPRHSQPNETIAKVQVDAPSDTLPQCHESVRSDKEVNEMKSLEQPCRDDCPLLSPVERPVPVAKAGSEHALKLLKMPYLRVPGAMTVSDVKEYVKIFSPWIPPKTNTVSDCDVEIGFKPGKKKPVSPLTQTLLCVHYDVSARVCM